MYFLGLPVFVLIDLVLELKRVTAEWLHRGMREVVNFHDDGCVRTPRVTAKRAADHIPVRLVVLERVGGRVESHEAVTFLV